MKKCTVVLTGLIIIICTSLLSSGCSNETGTEYKIYYTDKTRSELVDVSYKSETQDEIALAKEIIDQMNKKPRNNENQIVKPENVEIYKTTLIDNTIYVYLSGDYNGMSSSDKAILRAAMVKGLVQIDGIDYVHFYVDGLEVMQENGKPLGDLSADSYIDDANEIMGSVEWKNINLYFADKSGTKIVKSNVSVACSKNSLIEKVIVERLIKGPSDSNYMSTLPEDTKLLSVSVSNGICYVNLNSAFLTEMVNVSTEIPIYSIVNSLCELENVNNVKIMVNGDSNNTFHEGINLNTTFSYNSELMEEK